MERKSSDEGKKRGKSPRTIKKGYAYEQTINEPIESYIPGGY